jgi:hypothetical protein
LVFDGEQDDQHFEKFQYVSLEEGQNVWKKLTFLKKFFGTSWDFHKSEVKWSLTSNTLNIPSVHLKLSWVSKESSARIIDAHRG